MSLAYNTGKYVYLIGEKKPGEKWPNLGLADQIFPGLKFPPVFILTRHIIFPGFYLTRLNAFKKSKFSRVLNFFNLQN